jgi:hypothetical protein
LLSIKKTSAALFATALIGVGVVAPASAQNQSGLVNVAVANNTVQIPIGVAANVCGVAVNVLSTATLTNPVNCTAISGATATSTSNGGGGGGNQQGLVNLSITNNTIQVPVGVAANVCGVAANVLAQGVATGTATCNALGNSTATG